MADGKLTKQEGGSLLATPTPFESEWLDFELLAPRRLDHKTCSWAVRGKRNGAALGYIHWYGPWRQYVFYPAVDTLFNRGCLRDIATFCERVHRVRASASCAACQGDPEAHGLHVCGKDPFA